MAFDFNRYHKKRNDRLIAECRARLGGKCVRCGATVGLEFDHIEPGTREFAITEARNVSKERLERELAKCQLLCRPCHIEKSRETGELPPAAQHGTLGMYRHQRCRCDLCRGAQAAYSRQWRAKNGRKKMPSGLTGKALRC